MPFQGTTTAVSAGDAGREQHRRVPPLHHGLHPHAPLCVCPHRQHGTDRISGAELYNIDFAQPEIAARALAENADFVLGVKVRMSENVIAKHGIEPLRRAIRACELSGVAGAKVMCHIGGVENVELMSEILQMLRPRDILTHCYSGAPNIAGRFTNIVQDGKLVPAALDAKKRGIYFDVGHGGGSFDYTVAEAAIAQGAGPDTISSDMHVFSGNSPGMPFLTWVMSKFLNMGFSLEQVIAMATINPARVIDRITGARHARCWRAGGRQRARSRRRAGRVCRHAQQQASRQSPSAPGAYRPRRNRLWQAVLGALQRQLGPFDPALPVTSE